jgi:3-dehydroquinate synthetase
MLEKVLRNTKFVLLIKPLPKNELNRAIDKKAKVLIVTDSGLPNAYLRALKQSIKNSNVYVHIINKGEKAKSFKNYQQILKKLIDLKFSRTDLIVAFGGGVVGDIAGFSAATFLRGIDYIQIPTTLLSQVDSSVGGKTAINVPQGKNLVGAFYNPKLVLISTTYLKTLSEKEYKSGLGEVIKYAFIDNQKLRSLIENNHKK